MGTLSIVPEVRFDISRNERNDLRAQLNLSVTFAKLGLLGAP